MAINRRFCGKHKDMDEAIFKQLEDKPCTVYELVKETGYESKDITSRLTRMRGDGRVCKMGKVYKGDKSKHTSTLWGLR